MAYLLAIGSAVLYGAADFAGGLTTRRASPIPVALPSQAPGLIMLALIMPLLSQASPARAGALWGAAAGLSGGIGVALLYHALATGTMGVVAPRAAVCAVAIPVVVSMWLGERPMPLAVAGIALGMVSIVLVSQQQGGTQAGAGEPGLPRSRQSGVGIALVAGIAIGVFLLSFAQAGSTACMWPLLVARTVSTTLFAVLANAGGPVPRMPAQVTALVIFAGVMDMLANALYLLAARQGPLSIVVTLSSLYPASTVLLARIVLGERLRPWQVTGVGCALAAVVLIVSGGR